MTLKLKNNTFEIIYNKDILDNPDKTDWSLQVIGKLKSQIESGISYQYGYSDYKPSSQVEDYNEKASILSLVEETDYSEDEAREYYITSTNQVLRKSVRYVNEESYDDIYEYELLTSGFEGNDLSGESFSMVSDISPLTNNVHHYWWRDYMSSSFEYQIPMGEWYVPEWDGDRFTRPEKPALMLYWGVKNCSSPGSISYPGDDLAIINTSPKYPYISGHNYDAAGNRLGDLSLQWQGEDGLLGKYHQEFKSWIEKDKLKIEGLFQLTALDLKNLDITERKHVKGTDYFVEKIEVTIWNNRIDPARVYLIESDPE